MRETADVCVLLFFALFFPPTNDERADVLRGPRNEMACSPLRGKIHVFIASPAVRAPQARGPSGANCLLFLAIMHSMLLQLQRIDALSCEVSMVPRTRLCVRLPVPEVIVAI